MFDTNNTTYNQIKHYTGSCFKETAQIALNEISTFYINRYKRLWFEQNYRNETKIQRWVNHSRINFFFGVWMADSYLNNKYFNSASIIEEMNITRTTARKLILDTSGEGWITTNYDHDDKRVTNYKGSKQFYLTWETYIAYTVHISDIDKFRKSVDIYKYCMDKMKDSKQSTPFFEDNIGTSGGHI